MKFMHEYILITPNPLLLLIQIPLHIPNPPPQALDKIFPFPLLIRQLMYLFLAIRLIIIETIFDGENVLVDGNTITKKLL